VKDFFNALKTGWLPAAYEVDDLDGGIRPDRGSLPVRTAHDGAIQFDRNTVSLDIEQAQ
jgi:hypothetical protein